jgi:hypothetical protein
MRASSISATYPDMLRSAFAASTRSQSAMSSRKVMVRFFIDDISGECKLTTKLVQHENRVNASRYSLSILSSDTILPASLDEPSRWLPAFSGEKPLEVVG